MHEIENWIKVAIQTKHGLVLRMISMSFTTITKALQRKLNPQDDLIIKFMICLQTQTNKCVPVEEAVNFKYITQAGLQNVAKQTQPLFCFERGSKAQQTSIALRSPTPQNAIQQTFTIGYFIFHHTDD